MKRTQQLLLWLLIIACVLPSITAAQDDPALQQVLGAYEAQLSQNTYTRYDQMTLNEALTLVGTNASHWVTRNITQQTALDVDRASNALRGTIQQDTGVLSSDTAATTNDAATLNFVAVDGELYVQPQPNTDMQRINTSDLQTYDAMGLPTLISPPSANEVLLWLRSARSVENLGVRRGVQRYLLSFDLSDQMPLFNFDLGAFTQRYAEFVDRDALADALPANSEVSLLLLVDAATNTLLGSSALLQISLSIEGEAVGAVSAGDGIFHLEYAQQVDSSYENQGATFNISAP